MSDATTYFLEAIEGVRANEARYAQAEARSRAAALQCPPDLIMGDDVPPPALDPA